MHVADVPDPDRLHVELGEKVPVLLLDQLTTPPGVTVPGETSDTVTMQVVGTPTVIDVPQEIAAVVDIGLTVKGSQLLVA